MQPLENFQRPLTSRPPGTNEAGCGGKMPPAKTTSGPLAYTFSRVASGKDARYTGLMPKLATQPAEPSAWEISSTIRQNSAGERSSPPKRLGTRARYTPSVRKRSMTSSLMNF
ncbi:hypothetical protein D9M71_738650 [compost metagenome]